METNPNKNAVITVVIIIVLAFLAYLVFGQMRNNDAAGIQENVSSSEEDRLITELEAAAEIDSSTELNEIDKEFAN